MPKKLIKNESYLVRASSDRRKWGGIWALERWITLKWHKLDLLPDEVAIVERSGHLEIKPFEGNESEEFIPDEKTRHATRTFPETPTILQSVLSVDEEEEEDEEEFVVDDTEKTSDTLEEVMRKQEAHFGVDTQAEDEVLTKRAKKVKAGKEPDPIDELLEE